MLEAYIYDGLRTPFGRHSGALARVRPDDLLAGVIKEVVARSGFSTDIIDDVSIGCTSQAGEDSRNVARHALLLAGLPIETPGYVHNRLCGSGLNALVGAAHAITCGEADVCIAGGVESMTRAPFVVGKADQPFTKNFTVFDSSLGARFPNPKIESLFGADTMPETSDNLAREHQLSREECDLFALGSQQKYAKAHKDGFFNSEIKSVSIPQPKGKPDVVVAEDEHPRPDTSMDSLLKLKPLFAQGVTTAGNASQLSDGAAAAVMMDADLAARRGLPILGLFRGMQLAAVAPEEMSIAVTPAIRKLMKQHKLGMSDVDLWELHEAFAVTTLYNQSQLETPWDITNVNGGAVALGHPYGMSGIRYLGQTLLELARRGAHRAIVGVCAAGGMATAAYLERT